MSGNKNEHPDRSGGVTEINMAKTRTRKEEEVRAITEHLEGNGGFISFGFPGASAERVNALRGELRGKGGIMKVVKRSLLKRALEARQIPFEAKEFPGQTALAYFAGDASDIAGALYGFVKETTGEFLGGFDAATKGLLSGEYVLRLGQLPSREVLLGQVVGGISGPLRAFVYTLKAMSEK